MDVSNFAEQMMGSSGIGRLMDDLAGALATPEEMIPSLKPRCQALHRNPWG